MTKDRLLRRAQLVARLHHPNLARMLPLPGGAGLTPVTNGAQRLADFSTSQGSFGGLELTQVIWLLLDVLSGLRALHELEIDGSAFVHGAISPQYILLGEPGTARLVPVTSAHLNASAARETSGYAAPEALLGGAPDLRADLFSIGVLLWEALAQRRLFADGTRDAVMAQLASGKAPALGGLVSARWALPLCQVAERAVAVAPAARFSNALELSSAIVAAVGPQLTSPKAAPRAARWRSATPMSIVIDLPPPPSDAECTRVKEVVSESQPAPPAFAPQPALSPHWQRWQPILAGLAAFSLVFGAWQLAPRPAQHAAGQTLATLTAPPTPTVTAFATAIDGVSPPSGSALAAPSATRPVASGAATLPARNATPRKQPLKRHTAQQADGDYGI